MPERENRLEGYLYPDTYFFDLDVDCETIINKLLSRFDEVYTEEFKSKAESLGKTTDEIVTIASMIEGEIKVPEERTKASAVIYNRLEIGMPLQLDATVLYAKNISSTERVTQEDLEFESDYNTYQVPALPKGPIGNPGVECIRAAVNPDDVDYIYYVVNDDSVGSHFFTANYNEFLKAKEEYIKKFN